MSSQYFTASLITLVLSMCTGVAAPSMALADDVPSNTVVLHHGEPSLGNRLENDCYAKSTPKYTYDPDEEIRQQGETELFLSIDKEDVLIHTYDWFSQSLHIYNCGSAEEVTVARHGPWHRGSAARSDHLALAFYRGGQLLRRYSTEDITHIPSAH
ncbi:hypothetical protein [Yoonia sp. SS1-5]|uniref:Uncharacterized protein n=1 Tax=Yoonia rhodophyticola TaxID=3137370 RepID=A0AAN0NIU1_9RHOB